MRIRCPSCGGPDAVVRTWPTGRGNYECTCAACGTGWLIPRAALISAHRSRALPGPEPAPPVPDTDAPPHVTGKVLGFRCWALDGYKLMSANAHFGYWQIGVNQAECRRSAPSVSFQRHIAALSQAGGIPPPEEPAKPVPTHEAPAHDCGCGLYAYHDPAILALHGMGGLVFGAVLAWGRMEVHASGFRAQYAEPVVLAYDPQQPYELVKRAEAIAGEMMLPLVALEELEAEAAKHGPPVAVELRPKLARVDMGVGFASGGAVAPPSALGLSVGWAIKVTKPSPRRRTRATKIASASNLSAAALNLILFGLEPQPLNLSIGLATLLAAALIWWPLAVYRDA